jgi:prepilin-type N-terminal cleavage/methylation domain-containing protein
MKYNTSQQSGFSLVETLVAITILLIVITGPMSISSSTAKSTSFASEQVVAFFLAQEGAEIAQRARDDLYLQNFPSDLQQGWDDFTTETTGGPMEFCYTTNGCGLELNTDTEATLIAPFECSGDACRLYTGTLGERAYYTHEDVDNDKTIYSRVVTMEVVGTDLDEVHVVSTVTWRTGSLIEDQEVVVETYLYNFYGDII